MLKQCSFFRDGGWGPLHEPLRSDDRTARGFIASAMSRGRPRVLALLLLAPALLAAQKLDPPKKKPRLDGGMALLQYRAESLGLSLDQFWINGTVPEDQVRIRGTRRSVGEGAGSVLIVGANGGTEVNWFGQQGFRVLGVECLPREFARLSQQHIHNGECVTLISGCASDAAGLKTLHLAGDSSSMHEANVKPERMKVSRELARTLRVPTFRLDPIVRDWGDHLAPRQSKIWTFWP